MSLLRFAARTMLASFFVVNGIKALRDPEPLVSATEPIANTFLPLAEKTLPPQAAAYLPEDAKGLVKVSAVAQILGGVSLATGLGRRLGAAVLAVSMVPELLASNPFGSSDKKGGDTFLRDVALTGASCSPPATPRASPTWPIAPRPGPTPWAARQSTPRPPWCGRRRAPRNRWSVRAARPPARPRRLRTRPPRRLKVR